MNYVFESQPVPQQHIMGVKDYFKNLIKNSFHRHPLAVMADEKENGGSVSSRKASQPLIAEEAANGKDANGGGGDGGGDVALKAKMSLLNGCTVIVGSIIGSGIFVSPTGVITHTGSVNLALIVWTASGIFSMVGAYCYAELGTMITKSGADYAYIMETFGPFMAFIRLWIECMIVRPCSQAIVALTFSVYVMKPFFPDCEPPGDAARMLAVCCIRMLLRGREGLRTKNDHPNLFQWC